MILICLVKTNEPVNIVTDHILHFVSQQHSPLLKAFTTQGLSELTLLLRIQEYCYDNIHFMKAFQKIVLLLYKGSDSHFIVLLKSCNRIVPKPSDTFPLVDVLSEEAILRWYNEAHLAKGKGFFLDQMKKFVEWLKNAEEGEYQFYLSARMNLFGTSLPLYFHISLLLPFNVTLSCVSESESEEETD